MSAPPTTLRRCNVCGDVLPSMVPCGCVSESMRADFEERAAIIEHDGGATREEAEASAITQAAQAEAARILRAFGGVP